MDEKSLLLENPLLKILLLEDERSDWVNPIFYERVRCGEFHTLFPMLLEQASKFFEYFRMGSETFWYILHNIRPYISSTIKSTPVLNDGILFVIKILHRRFYIIEYLTHMYN